MTDEPKKAISKNGALQLFDGLSVWKRGGERAPHKPLLVLYALAKCLRGEERLIPFGAVDVELRQLLLDFGPARKSCHPEYPFWRLQHDKVWTVEAPQPLVLRKGNTDPKKSELLKHRASGGFPSGLYNLMRQDPDLVGQIAQKVLVRHFPNSIHADILQAVGLPQSAGFATTSSFDGEFKFVVLQAYGYRCAVCGYEGSPSEEPVGLEAAHIKWPQAGGPDIIPNGVCLCVLHRKAFDRGVIGISKRGTVLVSEKARASRGLDACLVDLDGQHVDVPQRTEYRRNEEFVAWHLKEVFRGPTRTAA